MKNSKILKTAFWLAIIAAWYGIYHFGRYYIDMYYSQLAPKQLVDDSTYGLLKFYDTADWVAIIVFVVVLLILLRQIFKIYSKKPQ